MAGSVFKRCGCKETVDGPDGTRRQRDLGRKCPALARGNESWGPRHGSWGFQLEVSVPDRAKRCQIRQFGHPTHASAAQLLSRVQELLGVARYADDPAATRLEIAETIQASLRARRVLPEAHDVRAKIILGQSFNQTLTLEMFLREWITGKKDIKPGTRHSYRQHIDGYLIPLLGHHRLDRLRVAHVQAAFDQIIEQAAVIAPHDTKAHLTPDDDRTWHGHDNCAARPTRAPLRDTPACRYAPGNATVQLVRATLRSALSDACKQQLITVNVAKLVNLPSVRRPRPKMWNETRVTAWRATGQVPGPVMVWTVPQTRAFVTAAQGHRLYPLYLLIAHCGLRRGEAVGLRWEDVDLATGIIEIRQQIVQTGGWRTETTDTKSGAGERTIIAVPTVLDALKTEHGYQQHRRERADTAWQESGLAFTTDIGTSHHPSHVTRQFQHLTKAAGLPPIRLHDLRHGAATHALTAGVPLKTVSDMLGHSTYAITADTYTSVADEAKRSAAHAIADLLAADTHLHQPNITASAPTRHRTHHFR